MSSVDRPIRPPWLDAQKAWDGRYALGPLLGQGGMGEVREAWDGLLCRRVALKILRRMDPVSLMRFMREAQAQSRVVHPNICQVYDVDSSGGVPRIAMQLVRGPTLADVAADLTVAEIVRIMALVAGAVHAAHSLELIHRDLKPSNILLEPNPGGGWTPYVCDFGLAIGRGDATLTAPDWINGTPAYMAPEQAQGGRALLGPATDVFALGGTLRFALRGERPGDPTRQALGPRVAGPVPRPLEAIMEQCLDPDPAFRYPTAAALEADLVRFSRGEPVRARTGRLIGRPLLRLHKCWKRTLTAGLAASSLVAGLGLAERSQAAGRQRRIDWAKAYALEAEAMERELGAERLLPPHDLRPAYASIRSSLRSIQERLGAQGPEAQGPGRYALGRGLLLLRDNAGASEQMEQAWAGGCREPGMAEHLVRALVGVQSRLDQESLFAAGALPSEGVQARAAAEAEALAQREPGQEDYLAALLSCLRRDYPRAAAQARMSIPDRPWLAAGLESQCLSALGRQSLESGNLRLAEARYGQAQAVAQRFLETDPSDAPLRHAYLQAARGLAMVMQERGQASLPFLARAQAFSILTLQLDPGDPELQDDWLYLSVLKAQALASLGQDPEPLLDAALVFLASRAQEPLTVELRTDRMLIQWLRAEAALRQGRDPGPALASALADLGHTSFLGRDYFGEVLNFKARVEAAQGRDPRPTLDDALWRLGPLMDGECARSLRQTVAEARLLRARWEADHGQVHGRDRGPGRGRGEVFPALAYRPGVRW